MVVLPLLEMVLLLLEMVLLVLPMVLLILAVILWLLNDPATLACSHGLHLTLCLLHIHLDLPTLTI